MLSTTVVFAFFVAALFAISIADDKDEKLPLWHGITGAPWIRFKLDEAVSDEFNDKVLDEKKWDTHGLRNENTGCPGWNGATNYPETQYSTYFATSTEPFSNGTKVPHDQRQYYLKDGMLHLRISKKPASYFHDREYFCNATTFSCNFDKNRPCYATKFNGEPLLRDPNDPTSYRFINHDKCKVEPFCIPHPEHVVGNKRMYENYVAPNVVGRTSFRYGFFEVNVKIPRSSAVSAVWMYDQSVFPSYTRYLKAKPDAPVMLESPSSIRSRRWEEIDMLEVMHTWSQEFCKQYIPNVHVFAMYKGEFTRPTNSNDGNPLGPIVLDKSVFEIGRNPDFNGSDPSRANSWHMNPGPVATLKEPWSYHFHRVGLYWSETEIRFILDGEEVLRVKNTIVHQRMFMVFSMSWNLFWSGVFPKEFELDRDFIVDYIRRWDVEADVPKLPSKLPLDLRMETSFESMGNNFGAVDGRFPIQDDNRSVELHFQEEILQNGRKRRKGVWRKKLIPHDLLRTAETEDEQRIQPEYLINTGRLNSISGGYEEEETGRKRKVVGSDVCILESRGDRNREPREQASYDPMNAVTVYEDHDPNAVGAGWAA